MVLLKVAKRKTAVMTAREGGLADESEEKREKEILGQLLWIRTTLQASRTGCKKWWSAQSWGTHRLDAQWDKAHKSLVVLYPGNFQGIPLDNDDYTLPDTRCLVVCSCSDTASEIHSNQLISSSQQSQTLVLLVDKQDARFATSAPQHRPRELQHAMVGR